MEVGAPGGTSGRRAMLTKGGSSSGLGASSALPSTHQKVRKILEDHASWQEHPGETADPFAGGPRSVAGNFSIVASRGPLARNSFAVRETPPGPGTAAPRKKAPLLGGKVQRERSEPRNAEIKEDAEERGRNRPTRNGALLGDPDNRTGKNRPFAGSLERLIPDDFKEDFLAGDKSRRGRFSEEGILGRSSAFLASLASPGSRSKRDQPRPRSLERSSSLRAVPTSWKKRADQQVKKSVSFSSDTSFEEKRPPRKKTAVHEAKVYHRGVLQAQEPRVPEESSEEGSVFTWGPKVLLRAAREADEETMEDVVTRIREPVCRGRTMDLNAVDGSGRTAVSYMAGNGACAMLEAALSFPGLDPNIPDNEGNTPLHFAAQAGHTECLSILLEKCPGIEVDARNALGFTPLMKAALQGRTKCAKLLLFAGANPTLRDHGRGLRAEQWARFCGRYSCADVIERFARHRLLDRNTSCRWGSEPELAAKVLQGKVTPVPTNLPPASTGLKSRIRRVFRTTSGPDRGFSLVTQLTSAALCASSPALPKAGDVPPVVKSLLRPLSVPQLRVTLVPPLDG
ncbi:uncharacterized protein LOC105699126 isoform X2 [Orussus abietinus]|nr:uncharacterized protein LOC105699126 isoform X2 [Orussus abietinus]